MYQTKSTAKTKQMVHLMVLQTATIQMVLKQMVFPITQMVTRQMVLKMVPTISTRNDFKLPQMFNIPNAEISKKKISFKLKTCRY